MLELQTSSFHHEAMAVTRFTPEQQHCTELCAGDLVCGSCAEGR